MNSVIDILNSKEDLLHGTGASDQQISDAEGALMIHFAADYKEYLHQFAIASFEGRELTGITASQRVNVVTVTKAERERNPEERKNLYVIEQTNMDDIVYWQSETGKVYRTYGIETPVEVYNSLADYYK